MPLFIVLNSLGLKEKIMPQYEDNNDFAKYDYYKNGPSGPNIGQRQDMPVGAIRGIEVPVTRTNPSIARQMEDLEKELQMAFQNVAALNVALGPIMSSEPNIVRERPMENDSTSEYFQRMRGFVVKTMELNDELQKILGRIEL
jgi:hypothetical protein